MADDGGAAPRVGCLSGILAAQARCDRVPPMTLRLVRSEGSSPAQPAVAEGDAYPFAETALAVAFADASDLSDVSAGRRLALAATPEISSDDAYLVLPHHAREALVPAFARGEAGRVAQWFSEAWVVRAELDGGRAPRLWIGAAWKVSELLARRPSRVVSVGGSTDATRAVNRLPFVAALARGGLLDARGAAAILSRGTYVGVSRMGVAELGLGADAAEPTFVWTEACSGGARVCVALAPTDDDAAVALVAPLTLVA